MSCRNEGFECLLKALGVVFIITVIGGLFVTLIVAATNVSTAYDKVKVKVHEKELTNLQVDNLKHKEHISHLHRITDSFNDRLNMLENKQ